ncbi:MAG TPA: EamA family transporter [Sphingomonas sp.]
MTLEPARSARTIDRSTLIGIAALMVAMVSFQFGASLAKGMFPAVGAEGTTTLRQGFGALMLAIVMRPWRTPVTRVGLPALLGYGVALGIMNLLFYMALATVPLGVAVALEFVGPLIVAAFGLRRVTDALWLVLAVLGLVFLLPLRASTHAIDPAGAALALAAGGCWALYIVFGQRAGRAFGTHAAAWGAIVAALVAAPAGIHQAGWGLLAPAILPSALALAFLSNAMPYTLEIVALTRMPARLYGTLTSLEPALGSLVGLVLLHEGLDLIQWLAIGAIVIASIGTTLSIRPAAPIAPDATP